MSTDYMSASTVSDHDLTLALPGEVGSVRARLIDAIQKLGYKVLGEQPIYAKRTAKGCAMWDCSLNVLDYPTTLTISLKQTNDVSVLATFSYEIKSYMRMTKGDRQTLAREAEAAVALATERLEMSACRACGTQVTDESHFCRRCGAPLVLDVPEMEVLRLTRNARASFHNIVFAMLMLLAAVLTVLAALLFKGVIYTPVLWIAVPLAAYAVLLVIQGAWQLYRTLNPAFMAKSLNTNPQRTFNNTSVTTALPAAYVNASITEGTTELLLSTRDRREKEPVPRKDHDTAEIDTDHLM
jgi:ribosomal protein L40E